MWETPYTRIEPFIQDLSEAISPFLEIPYAIFGHSFGAMVSFELSRSLRKRCEPSPIHLFVSACAAPHLLGYELPASKLSDQDFLERLRSLNGTPREVLKNTELLQVLLPTIRADFSVLESYVFSEEPALESKITIFGGMQDQGVDIEKLGAWRIHTTAPSRLQMFPGDHFFLQSSLALLLRAIAQDLLSQ